MNLNSWDAHKMTSSDRREICIMKMDEAEANSIAKSLSDTPSRLFMVISVMPSFDAEYSRLRGYVVPARAPEPKGEILQWSTTVFIRSISLPNISM